MLRSVLMGLLLTTPGFAQPMFVVRTSDPNPVVGAVRGIDPVGSTRLKNEGIVEVDTGKIVSIRQRGQALPSLPRGSHLVLSNGDRIPVTKPRMIGEVLYIRHPDLSKGHDTKLSIEYLRLIWWRAPDDVADPERLERQLATSDRRNDVVLLANGDRVEGTLTRLDGDKVYIEVRGRTLEVEVSRVAVLALSTDLLRKLRAKGQYARVVLAHASGSTRIAIREPTCSDAKTLEAKTLFGADVRVPLERVLALDFVGGAVEYLSSRKPTKYEAEPFFSVKRPLGVDSSVLGHALRVGSSVYDRGLGMMARSRVTYSLDGKARWFEAVVGLDRYAGRGGRARVRVLVDDKPLSLPGDGVLDSVEALLELRLDVSGGKSLTLEVDFADRGNVRSRVNWANARLVK